MLELKPNLKECDEFNITVKQGGFFWHTGLDKYVMVYDALDEPGSGARLRKINYCPYCGKAV